jgi:adenosine kinase
MKIVITGSVAYDYLMTFPGSFKEQIIQEKLEAISLSFLVETLVKRRGGIAPNIAYNLALLGGKPSILATVGEDFEDYRAWLEEQGVDTSLAKVIEGKFTASFFATTDQHNAQLASFYPGAMADAAQLSISDISPKPDIVLISPNDPAAMEKYIRECKQLVIPYIYDPSQQIARMNGDDLREGIQGALALFLNEYEFELAQKKTGMTKDEILAQVEFTVVTLGADGVAVYHEGEEYKVASVPPKQIFDPTGAGDAFRGGFLTGYSRGWDWKTCAQMGALTATYCLESDGPQGHSYSKEEFITRYQENYKDDGLLNTL